MKNADNGATKTSLKDQITALYELMKSEKIEELEIKENDFHIFLKRKGKNAPVLQNAQVRMTPAIEPAEAEPEAEEAGDAIKSPITGVFYRAPSPSSPPFAKEGDIVDPGKTLCIVEAMKVMNEIKAEYRVKILKIFLENGKPVNSGQNLFLVERA